MSNDTLTVVIAGAAAGISVIAWAMLVLVPAWTSYSRVWERARGDGAEPLCARGVRARRIRARRRDPLVLRRDLARPRLDLSDVSTRTPGGGGAGPRHPRGHHAGGRGRPRASRGGARRGPRARRLPRPDRSLEQRARGRRALVGGRALADDRRRRRRHARAAGRRRGGRPAAPARALRRGAVGRAAARDHDADRLRGRAPARARAGVRGRAGRTSCARSCSAT